jgi:hypothetical protein
MQTQPNTADVSAVPPPHEGLRGAYQTVWTHPNPEPTTQAEYLGYSLSKQVPDMARGFTIATNYGDITVEPGQAAERIRKVVESVLMRELAKAGCTHDCNQGRQCSCRGVAA